MNKFNFRKRKILRRIIIFVILIFLIGACAYTVFERRLSEVIHDMSVNTVKSRAAVIISTAIYDEIDQQNITYDKLVSFEKDNNGDITALKTDIIEINRFKSKLSVKILNDLTEMDTTELSIPIGTVVGSHLLVGKGPGIKVNVIPVGTVQTEVINEIRSAGINQSRHQLMMKITADLTIITSVTSVTTQVVTYICIAETVIVGDVPGSYTNIDTNEDVFDKYNDFIM